MHIVFICDENYVMPTVVAITSIYENKDEKTSCYIHIMAIDVSEKSKSLFLQLEHDGFKIDVLDLSQSERLKSCEIANFHVSTAALYKFHIANIFSEYSKILYLDGDILVKRDLLDLYNMDLNDSYAAVVKDYKPMTYIPSQVEKLGIMHNSYFNSGVMLLNLEKLRNDNMAEKLLDYRLNGINYFMDQDALNVVFEENVIYLPFYNNVMSSVVGAFKLETLAEYYDLGSVTSKQEIYNNAAIIHLCTKYKPWEYNNVPFAEEWLFYYRKSHFTENLILKRLDRKTRNRLFNELGYQMLPGEWGIKNDVIVSFTSFPERIKYTAYVIESLKKQTVQVDKIILWLASSQFPLKENELPKALLEQLNENVEIRWCDDLKPHKKYFYTMQEYPDSIVITVDDDVYYKENLVETLLDSYVCYPYAISAMRAHQITLDEENNIAPYSNWKREYKEVGIPSLALIATGIGGVLYPPHVLPPEVFNVTRIIDFCLFADDLWLKIMQVITNTPVVVASKSHNAVNIEGSQEEALWKKNDLDGANDEQLKKILDYYNDYVSDQDRLVDRIRLSVINMDDAVVFSKNQPDKKLKEKTKQLAKEIENIQKSKSYCIGRIITFIPRKFMGGIQCYKDHGFIYTVKRTLEHLGIPMGIEMEKTERGG